MFHVVEPERPLLSFIYNCMSYPPFNPWSDRLEDVLLQASASGFYTFMEKKTNPKLNEGGDTNDMMPDITNTAFESEGQSVEALTVADLMGVLGLALVFLAVTGLVFVVEKCKGRSVTRTLAAIK